jgi:cytochrome c oxidase subunit 3
MQAHHAVLREEKPWQSTPYLGMALFLISESFLFGSLFWTYFYLRGRLLPDWPPQGVQLAMVLVSINTAILLSSSGTMQWAIGSVQRGSRGGLVLGLLATIALGATFLGITGWEWVHVPFRPWSHAYGSIFYTLTGFHGAHVLGDLLLLLALLVRAWRGLVGRGRSLAVEVGGLYWHFVDAVWVGVFTSLFIIR